MLFLSALLLAADKDLVTERDYYLQVDAAYAATWRAKPSTDRAMFFLAQNGVSTGTAMSESGVLGSSFASGLRLTATILPTFQNELQGRFLGLLQWSGHSEVYNASQLIHVPLTPHYSLQWAEANDVYARDNLLFNSFDIAWIYQATPKRRDYFSFGLNLGPRYIQLRDTMSLSSVRYTDNVKSVSTGSSQEKNYLGGLQFGFDFSNNPTWYFTWGISTRGALYANTIVQKYTFYIDNDATLFVDQKKTWVRFSQGLEITPYVVFEFGEFYIKPFFEFLALWNIAKAPRQYRYNVAITSTWAKSHLYFYTANIACGLIF